MNRDLKKKWVAALRSGTYRQGRTLLRNVNGEYCCLGILCEVAGIEWEYKNKPPQYTAKGHKSTLPTNLNDEIGRL